VREKEKQFSSFTHFLQTTSNRKVNKKTIESLIKVGTMDAFANRSSMLENLEQIRQTADQFSSEIDGQDNLFANVETKSAEITDNFIELEEYPKQEILSFEKELLGIYLTDHPLADVMQIINKRTNMKIGEIDPNLHQDQIFLFGGVISRFKEVVTKTGRKMAFATLEDTSGKVEFLIFPKLYQKWIGQLAEDSVILIRAKVQNRDGEIKLITEKISLPKKDFLKKTEESRGHEIFVPRKTSKESLKKLGELLKSNLGDQNITIVIPNGAKAEKINLPYKVNWSDTLAQEVDNLLK
jgi:DNA polymerase III subunit alpha